MTTNQVLYQFEHQLLPRWFYDEPKEFIGVLCESPSALFEILSELFRRGGAENPYKAGDFKVEPGEVNENVMMLRIDYPKPQGEQLCHSAICIFNKGFDRLMFFTIEKGIDLDAGFPIHAAWTPEGEHFNYGKVSPDKEEQLFECVSVYMSGEDRKK